MSGKDCAGGCGKKTKSKSGTCRECAKKSGTTPRRKKGSKKRTVRVDVVPTVCPKCGSSERTRYDQSRRVDQKGRLPDGRRYRAIIWRRCKCGTCGQHRSEKTYIVVESRLTNLG